MSICENCHQLASIRLENTEVAEEGKKKLKDHMLGLEIDD
jgi:hypothetical protein